MCVCKTGVCIAPSNDALLSSKIARRYSNTCVETKDIKEPRPWIPSKI